MDFVDELKNILVAETATKILPLIFGTNLFIGKMPDTLTKIVVLQKGNSNYQYNVGNKLGYSQEEIVIRIRGNQVENETRELAEIVENAIENINNRIMSSHALIRGYFSTPLYQLDGTDNNNNYIYVGVYTGILERS